MMHTTTSELHRWRSLRAQHRINSGMPSHPHSRPLVRVWPPAGPLAEYVARGLKVEGPHLTQQCKAGVAYTKLLV